MSALYRKHFWEWFKRHHHEYHHINKKTKKEVVFSLTELTAHLQAYCKYCDFVLEYKEKATLLTITVSGRMKYFRKAESLIAIAPDIPGWTFTALEDPRQIDYFVEEEIEKTGIDPREFYFEYSNTDPENIGLIIYHPLYRRENEKAINRLATFAVYNLLGERSYGQDISSLEVENLSTANRKRIQKLETLPESINLLKPDMVIDDKGNLVMGRMVS